MISIVMPTLWKGEHYKQMLPLLDAHPLIGEILVVDNNCPETDYDTLNKLNKLVHFQTKGNIFVNPSWNYGARHCSFDKLCFYSDDVLFDIKVIDDVYPFITEQNGVIGFSFETISETNNFIEFLDWQQPAIVPTTMFHYRFGICMFVHRKSYVEIPNEYKIYYGDSVLFDGNILNGKQNYRMENYKVQTKMGSTSKSFNSTIELDHTAYKKNNPSEAFVIDFMADSNNANQFL